MPDSLEQPITDYSRLTRADEALALQLAADGRTQTFIAQQLGCSQSTVSRVISDFTDYSGLAKRKAHNLAYKAVLKLDEAMDPAAKAGKSGPMEALLKMAGVLGEESQGPRVLVQIGVKDADVCTSRGPSPSLSQDLHSVSEEPHSHSV